MWRMRMRLLFGFVVLLALGHLPQESGVVAQKYYMNFAFNNNNPEGEGAGTASPSNDGTQTDHGMDPRKPNQNHNHPGDDLHDTGGGEGSTAGPGTDGGPDLGTHGEEHGPEHENENQATDATGKEIGNQPTGGRDDDNDDSDSKDAKNRREKLEQQEQNEKLGKRTDHSHHSSYEISIDDSFGGRYVRSIYESSESHGHSGSRAGSNARDSGARDSSQEGKNHAVVTDVPDNGNTEAVVTDGAAHGPQARVDPAVYNADYEEM